MLKSLSSLNLKIISLLFFIIILGCSEDGSKKFTFELGTNSYNRHDCNVIINNYGDRIYTKVSITNDRFRFRKEILDGFEIIFYDKNGIYLDFEEVFKDKDFEEVKSKKRGKTVFEGQLSTKLGKNKKYVFDQLEYIVIDYQYSDNQYTKTEKIKQNFW